MARGDLPSAAALVVRAARSADAAAAVPLIYSSGPAAFDYVFADARGNAQGFLARAFVAGDGEFGWRNHVVGVVDGAVVAVGSGFMAADTRGFTLAAARQICGWFGWRAVAPTVRGLRTEQLIRPPRRGEFYIGHVGVAVACRSRGYGAALLAWFGDRARQRGAARLVLDVAADNPRAEALYARHGFHVTVIRPSLLANARGAVPTQRRMECALAE